MIWISVAIIILVLAYVLDKRRNKFYDDFIQRRNKTISSIGIKKS